MAVNFAHSQMTNDQIELPITGGRAAQPSKVARWYGQGETALMGCAVSPCPGGKTITDDKVSQ